jgi:hypothetical protein
MTVCAVCAAVDQTIADKRADVSPVRAEHLFALHMTDVVSGASEEVIRRRVNGRPFIVYRFAMVNSRPPTKVSW